MGDKSSLAACVEGLARLWCGLGRPERAAQLFAVAEALREAIGANIPPAKRGEYEHNVAVVRTQLDSAAFARAWAVGRAMTLEETIECALAEDQP